MAEDKFQSYHKIQVAEMRPYEPGEDMTNIWVNDLDKEKGHPKEGDMVARNPRSRDDMWLVTKELFEKEFESVERARGQRSRQEF